MFSSCSQTEDDIVSLWGTQKEGWSFWNQPSCPSILSHLVSLLSETMFLLPAHHLCLTLYLHPPSSTLRLMWPSLWLTSAVWQTMSRQYCRCLQPDSTEDHTFLQSQTILDSCLLPSCSESRDCAIQAHEWTWLFLTWLLTQLDMALITGG